MGVGVVEQWSPGVYNNHRVRHLVLHLQIVLYLKLVGLCWDAHAKALRHLDNF